VAEVRDAMGRRRLLGTLACMSASGARVAPCLAQALPPYPPLERRVGVAYSLWHQDRNWQAVAPTHHPWGTPELGYYRSDDPQVMVRHMEWLTGAGVDFIILGWSNDLDMDIRRAGGPKSQRFIESTSIALFDTLRRLPSAPRIVLMIGNPGQPDAVVTGKLAAKADEVYDLFMADATHAPLLERYLGKPLLLVYVGTPSPYRNGLPPWRDDRFTVRFMTGFVTEQHNLLGPGGVSKYGYWSWEDRHRPSCSVYGGRPECVTAVAAWRGAGSAGRDAGRTYAEQWQTARAIGPHFVLCGTFNEWWVSEQIDTERSKDIEPSLEHGWRYMDMLRSQVALFKEGR
jgi:hypothetical protein